MKINGLNAEIENEGEYIVIKLKFTPQKFCEFVTNASRLRKITGEKKSEKNKDLQPDIDSRKKLFLKRISDFKISNEGKYPTKIYNDFYRWWTEGNGKLMRFEKENFFEVGKRLATFWGRISTEEKSKLWQLEKDQPKSTLL